jgi:2-phospho-L-lactate guanylyltransferase
MKQLRLAKSRMAHTLLPAERRALALAMLEDVLAALSGTPGLAGIGVVGDDQEVFERAVFYGAEVLTDTAGDLNGALTQAAQHYAARGADAVLVLPADVPQVTQGEISALIAAHDTSPQVVIAPSHDGGTGALLVAPPLAIAFQFGEASAARHVAAAHHLGIPVRQVRAAGLANDIDRADDMLLLPSGDLQTHTQRLLAELRIRQRAALSRAI